MDSQSRPTAAFAALAALVGSFAAAAFIPNDPVGWIASAMLLLAFSALVGFAINGQLAGLIIDDRNRVSLSKLQAAAWSVLVFSAWLTAVITRVCAGDLHAADVGIPNNLLAVVGISATSLAMTPVILSVKSGQAPQPGQESATAAKLGDSTDALASVGKVYARANAGDAQWLDLFRGEEVSNAASPDLGKIQQFLITAVTIIAYGATIWTTFAADHGNVAKTLAKLPDFSPQMAWLIGISHAGYLVYKAAPHGASSDAPTAASGAGAAADPAVG